MPCAVRPVGQMQRGRGALQQPVAGTAAKSATVGMGPTTAWKVIGMRG